MISFCTRNDVGAVMFILLTENIQTPLDGGGDNLYSLTTGASFFHRYFGILQCFIHVESGHLSYPPSSIFHSSRKYICLPSATFPQHYNFERKDYIRPFRFVMVVQS